MRLRRCWSRVLTSLLALWGAGAARAAGPPTAFTYQGQLQQAGVPVEGPCDFRFSLWDAETGGAQVGPALAQDGRGVHGGAFTALLDFGTDPFDGRALWLEVAVAVPAGSGAFTVLQPRHCLTPTPYALYALRTPWAGVVDRPAVLTSLNGVSHDGGDVRIVGGAGISISADGVAKTITISAVGAAGDADTLDGLHAAAFVQASALNDGDPGTTPLGWQDIVGRPLLGDITAVTAGEGLVGGATEGAAALRVGAGPGIAVTGVGVGLAPAYLDGSAFDTRFVNAGEAGAVTTEMVVDGSVTGAKIADGTLTGVDLAAMGASTGQVLKWDGTSWAPGTDATTGGAGFDADLLDGLDSAAFARAVHEHDSAYVNEGQAASLTTAMIVDSAVTDAKIAGVAWSKLTGVPADLADGDQDTQYSAGAGLTLAGAVLSVAPGGVTDPMIAAVAWSKLTGVPAGLADGDQDTQYSAGAGLALVGTTLSVADAGVTSEKLAASAVTGAKVVDGTLTGVDLAAMGASTGQVLKWDGTTWAPGTDATAGGAGFDADLLDGLDSAAFARVVHEHAGEGITSGSVAAERIAAELTRDSEVLGLVLAGDGAGSGLDADLLDGLHASTFATTAALNDNTPTTAPVGWADLSNVPAGFADGVDNTGVYVAGDGLSLGGIEFRVDYTRVAAASHEHSTASITSGVFDDTRLPASVTRDSDVMGLVLAGDGAGSGLDADLLDGLHASTFAAAAVLNDGDPTTTPVGWADLAGNGAADGQILKWSAAANAWVLAADEHGAAGTTYVAGEGLDLSGAVFSVEPGGITSAHLADGTIALADLGRNGAADGQVIAWSDALGAWTLSSDHDTTYVAGTGLYLGGTQFAVDFDVVAARVHFHTGEEVASGLLADARLPAGVARDAEVLGLVLAGDGADSGLDADLLDGQHASVFATAAALSDGNPATTPVGWTDLQGVPAGFADGTDNDSGGDITAVTAGTGLTGGGATGDVNVSIGTDAVDASLLADTLTLDAALKVTGGFSVEFENPLAAGQFLLDFSNDSPTPDQKFLVIAKGTASPTHIFAVDEDGDVTATRFIGDGSLLTGVVASDLESSGAVDTADLAPNAVTSDQILNGTILLADLGQNGATEGQILKWNAASSGWQVAVDTNTTYTAGNGLTLSGTVFSVTADSLDFAELQDSLDLDAATSIALAAYTLTINLSGTGDFVIQDNGVTQHTFFDNGNVQLGNDAELFVDSANTRVGIGTATPATTLQVNGTARIGSNLEVDGSFVYVNRDGPDGLAAVYFYDGGSATGESLQWYDSSSLFKLSAGLRIDGDLLTTGTEITVNIGGPDATQTIFFYNNTSIAGEYFRWDDPNDRFVLSDSLYIGADSYGDDDFLYFDQVEYLKWNNAAERFDFSKDLSIGADSDGDDDFLYFDAGFRSLKWDNAVGQFEFSDSLSIGADSTADDDYLYMDARAEYLKWDNAAGQFALSDSLSIGADSAADDDYLYMDVRAESLKWDNAAGQFEFSDDLSVVGGLAVTGTLTLDSLRANGTDLYVNYDGPDGTASLFFYNASSNTGEYLRWLDGTEQFEFSDDLSVGGKVTATATATGVSGTATSASGTAVHGMATATGVAANYGGRFSAAGNTGRGVEGRGTATGAVTNYGGHFTANGDSGRGVVGVAEANGAVANYGGHFSADGDGGVGIVGTAGATGAVTNYGGQFLASGDTAVAVKGNASGTAAATNYGGHFMAAGKTARAVFGYAHATGAATPNYGGYFEAAGDTGNGVYASATATSSQNYGGYFEAAGTSARAVFARATATTGLNYGGKFDAAGDTGRAVFGDASNAGAVTNYGGYFTAQGTTGCGVYGSGKAYDFYANGVGTNYGPFTGAHEAKLEAGLPADLQPGLIFSATGETQVRTADGQVSLSSTLPTVRLACTANDKAVFGVLVMEAPLPADHWYKAQAGERFAILNALGEGRVWVCDANGPVQTGDYITTSAVPGYGQKQDDDLQHSYTLGKAIETVDWERVTETVEFQGRRVKVYLIAVVYTSG